MCLASCTKRVELKTYLGLVIKQRGLTMGKVTSFIYSELIKTSASAFGGELFEGIDDLDIDKLNELKQAVEHDIGITTRDNNAISQATIDSESLEDKPLDNKPAPEILWSALRQYQHNDCSGVIAGFDYDEVVGVVAGLQAEIQSLECSLKEADSVDSKKEIPAFARDQVVESADGGHTARVVQLRNLAPEYSGMMISSGDDPHYCVDWIDGPNKGKRLMASWVNLKALD